MHSHLILPTKNEYTNLCRFHKGLPHMGYPNSLPVSYEWLEQVLAAPSKTKN
jgi:hypothetical protein